MKDLIISKELLGSVMEFKKQNVYSKDLDFIRLNENNIQFAFKAEHNIQSVFNINIYEFAFKCKEWAFNKMYFLSSGKDTSGGWCLIRDINKCFVNDENPYTEIEAIAKACEWVLENEQLYNN